MHACTPGRWEASESQGSIEAATEAACAKQARASNPATVVHVTGDRTRTRRRARDRPDPRQVRGNASAAVWPLPRPRRRRARSLALGSNHLDPAYALVSLLARVVVVARCCRGRSVSFRASFLSSVPLPAPSELSRAVRARDDATLVLLRFVFGG